MADRSLPVIWAHAAVRDLEEIVSFVASDSPVASERLLEKLRSRAGSLETSPHRGRIVPELQRMGIRTWRELVIRPYRLLYRVTGHAVLVLAVLDGRRDLEDVLLERLVRDP